MISAIKYLHSQRVLHVSMKQQHILFTAYGNIKISNFGVVKKLDPGQDSDSTIIENDEYISPEFTVTGSQSFSSDIWRISLIMHQILTLKPPFDISNKAKVTQQILNDQISGQIDSMRYSAELIELVNAMRRVV
ncbi:MAG: hypothetical protein EZS28_040837 [Streblomastix strix]|uniref:Protein kinase domain-containing protein n=1 Tax=Streblomastix strix TaxID=222440 RepID=A0A5J4TZD1_9EUKA|nr:MAG: hypothetical protein EZS28_040837 [Streblomastix strix]